MREDYAFAAFFLRTIATIATAIAATTTSATPAIIQGFRPLDSAFVAPEASGLLLSLISTSWSGAANGVPSSPIISPAAAASATASGPAGATAPPGVAGAAPPGTVTVV